MNNNSMIASLNNRLNTLFDYVRIIARDKNDLATKMMDIDLRLTNTETKITDINNKLTNIDNKLTDTDNRLTKTYEKLTDTDNRLIKTYEKLTDTDNRLTKTYEKLTNTYERLATIYLEYINTKDNKLTNKERKMMTETILRTISKPNTMTRTTGVNIEFAYEFWLYEGCYYQIITYNSNSLLTNISSIVNRLKIDSRTGELINVIDNNPNKSAYANSAYRGQWISWKFIKDKHTDEVWREYGTGYFYLTNTQRMIQVVSKDNPQSISGIIENDKHKQIGTFSGLYYDNYFHNIVFDISKKDSNNNVNISDADNKVVNSNTNGNVNTNNEINNNVNSNTNGNVNTNNEINNNVNNNTNGNINTNNEINNNVNISDADNKVVNSNTNGNVNTNNEINNNVNSSDVNNKVDNNDTKTRSDDILFAREIEISNPSIEYSTTIIYNDKHVYIYFPIFVIYKLMFDEDTGAIIGWDIHNEWKAMINNMIIDHGLVYATNIQKMTDVVNVDNPQAVSGTIRSFINDDYIGTWKCFYYDSKFHDITFKINDKVDDNDANK